jgi:1-deoxy-D-xylulose-5-phosphate synthase
VLLAVGRLVEVARAAAEQLAAEGIGCGVVNARWIKPLDPRLVSDWAQRYPVLVTAEDNVGSGGFGSAVMEALAPHGLAGKVRPVALPDAFLPHGKPGPILAEHGLDAAGLAEAVRAAVGARVTPA